MDHVLTTLIKKKKRAITLFKVENFTIKQVQNYMCPLSVIKYFDNHFQKQ